MPRGILAGFGKVINGYPHGGSPMRNCMRVLCVLTLTALAAGPVLAASAPKASSAKMTANPVVSSAKMFYQRDAKNMIAAAEEMPANKYSYHPTAGQWTFGKLVSHIAQSNGLMCGALSGMHAPVAVNVSPTASKSDLVAGLKASFGFCNTALNSVTDAKLGSSVTMFHHQMPRAGALISLTSDLADHYSQMAGYLRLNGMLPPSAQHKM